MDKLFSGLLETAGSPRARGLTMLALAAFNLMSAAKAQDLPDMSATDHGLEIYLSEDALQGLYARAAEFGEIDDAELYAGFFFNEARDLVGIAGLLTSVGDPGPRSHWRVRVGPRVYGAFLNPEDQDVFSLALGGKLSYFLTSDRSSAASLSAYYAPDIATFGEADDVTDVSLEFQTRLTSSIMIFVGYRSFEFDMTADREVDDGMHVGFRGVF